MEHDHDAHKLNWTCPGSYWTNFSVFDNVTALDYNNTNATSVPGFLKVLDHVNIACYLLICVLGLTGNSLVIYVVLMYGKLQTVTNIYMLNLAFSDMVFLTMLPITATTVIIKHWVFGLVMCKLYFVLCAVNIFGVAFNLCVMSADRYMAVCHPITSLKYRTPRIAVILCFFVWLLTFMVMIPVIMYTSLTNHKFLQGKYTCALNWPKDIGIHPAEAFVWYSFILGFALPVLLISIFYTMVIVKLRKVGAVKKSKDSRRARGRVTRLIFCIIAVYFICWLPYWSFQVHRNINNSSVVTVRMIFLFNGCTILSYTNSMLNPLLYAFLSENFRQSFLKAFKCISSKGNTRSERSIFPCTSETFMRTGSSNAIAMEDRVELPLIDSNSTALEQHARNNIYAKVNKDEQGFLKPPSYF